jgi:hypothetical protein
MPVSQLAIIPSPADTEQQEIPTKRFCGADRGEPSPVDLKGKTISDVSST